MAKKKIIIIGAGFGGLCAAALLAKMDFSVLILEKNKDVGGRARVFKEKGFTFDMGPSWYLMPDVFEHFFGLFDKKPADFFTLLKLNPAYRMFFDKKKVVDISENLEENIKLFSKLETNGAAKFKKYLSESEYKYKTAMSGFIYKEYKTFFDFFNLDMLKGGAKLRVFDSIDKYVRGFFTSDIARKILEYNIVFLGGNPENTPALYSIMAHIDFNLGVWYPRGGMGKLVNAVKKLALKYGAEILTNSPVTKIGIKDGKATDIFVGRKRYHADIVIANADYPFVEMQLLPKEYRTYDENYWKKRTIAPSAFIVYLGIKGKVKGLTHHNLFVEYDWMKHFDAIFKAPDWPEHFSYYVSCPTKTDPTVAPTGDENMFILVPIAPGIKDSPEMRETYYQKVMGMLEESIGEKITKRVIVKKLYSLDDFTADYNAYQGTALGLTHTLMQSAIFRPQMSSKKVKNLYYVGQYTHPGIGVPMVAIAAEIIANQINKRYG